MSISPQAFFDAFPFHIVFDRALTILQVGPVLQRACPAITPGASGPSCLRIKQPSTHFEFNAIRREGRAVFLLETAADGQKLLLRGQMSVDDEAGTVTFLGSPKVMDRASLTGDGVSLEDFAIHDAAADLLFLLQSKITTLSDAKRLTAELSSQKAELRRVNMRLAAQFAVTRILIDAKAMESVMPEILASLGDALGYNVGAWWEVERKAQVLRCAEIWNPSYPRFARLEAAIRGIPVPQEVGLVGQAWSSRRTFWASEVKGECPLSGLAGEVGLPGAIAFPITIERDVLGVLSFWSKDRLARDEDLQRLMMDTGAKIGQFAERRRAEEALRESEERYALAAQGAKDGLWDWKLHTGRVYYSPRWKAMLGYEERAVKDSLDEWFGRVHPDDRKKVEIELASHLEGQTEHFEVEHRMAHKDGAYRWMLARGIAVRDEAGNALRMAGTQTDVTERKQVELSLIEAREELSQKLSLVEEKERAILRLSTPIIRVWAGVLALPVIGSLDGARASQMTEALLRELVRTRAAVAVVDLTGVERVDMESTSHLIRMMQAVHLLGSRCVIAGVSPELARSFIELSVDMTGFLFFADVKSALARIFQWLGAAAPGGASPSRRFVR